VAGDGAQGRDLADVLLLRTRCSAHYALPALWRIFCTRATSSCARGAPSSPRGRASAERCKTRVYSCEL
jgi:hypothetical protein